MPASRSGPTGLTLVLALVLASACHESPTEPTVPEGETCGPYSDWQTSSYVLPYAVGTGYFISQGNCSIIGSHQGGGRHAYDFEMPTGTEIRAILGGTVVDLDVSHPDGTGQRPDNNFLQVLQEDGTYAAYVHLTTDGALVDIGDSVAQGQPIALSGNSGSTGGLPHLHLQLGMCRERNSCDTLPVTFRNTDPNPLGLIMGEFYVAQPF